MLNGSIPCSIKVIGQSCNKLDIYLNACVFDVDLLCMNYDNISQDSLSYISHSMSTKFFSKTNIGSDEAKILNTNNLLIY